MKQRPVIILNGPPGSGKDAIAQMLKVKCSYIHMEMKKRLHELAIAMSGISKYQWHQRYRDRELKDTPWELLPRHIELGHKSENDWRYMTQREYMIYVSEEVMKPAFGKTYFGEAALKELNKYKYQNFKFVFSDGGFPEELEVLSAAPEYKIIIVHLYREGCDFSNDSRNYVEWPGVKITKVYNNKTLEDACKTIAQLR